LSRSFVCSVKLDRLARDAHFPLGLQKAGVDFIACDMPQANSLTIGIIALVAEEEARAISARNNAALAVAKARGSKLGGWRGGPVVGAKAARKRADAFAAGVAPMLRQMQSEGLSPAPNGCAHVREGYQDASRRRLDSGGSAERPGTGLNERGGKFATGCTMRGEGRTRCSPAKINSPYFPRELRLTLLAPDYITGRRILRGQVSPDPPHEAPVACPASIHTTSTASSVSG